jgi:putative ABC transport system permease protein
MQVPLLAGRYFTATDTADSTPVIIINQTMARRWWPHQNAVGQHIKQGFPQDQSPYREIVGVVADVKQAGADSEQWPEVFLPATQNPGQAMTLVVRTARKPMSVAKAAEAAIQSIDKDQPVSAVQPMDDYMAESLEQRSFSALLLGIFGGLALLLAAVGIYGVTAYSVSQRTHEIGVRMALGAQRRAVLDLVLGSGLRLALAGIAVGLAASLMATRLISSLLFGVTARDPLTFAAVPAFLAAVALLACYLPARRAMRVDPMVALRYE